VRADLLVNRAFQPFCFFRNRSFEGRSKPPGKPRGYPSTQSSDSIEARNLTEPTLRSKTLFQTLAPNQTPKTMSPKPVGPARLRARRRYTSAPFRWQAPFHKKSKNPNKPESASQSPIHALAYTRAFVCLVETPDQAQFSPSHPPIGTFSVAQFAKRPLQRCFIPFFFYEPVAPQHQGRHKGGSSKGLSLSHRAAIAAILSPAQAAADLRVLSLGVLLLSVILIPLSQAVWMPAT